MITEMAKIDCKNTLDDLLNVIDEKGFEGINEILIIFKKDYAIEKETNLLTKPVKKMAKVIPFKRINN
jgi:uncharacterized protein (UPF0297 family)